MKVRIEIDDQLTEKEIVIKAPSYDSEVQNLYRIIQKQTEQTQSLVFPRFKIEVQHLLY